MGNCKRKPFPSHLVIVSLPVYNLNFLVSQKLQNGSELNQNWQRHSGCLVTEKRCCAADHMLRNDNKNGFRLGRLGLVTGMQFVCTSKRCHVTEQPGARWEIPPHLVYWRSNLFNSRCDSSFEYWPSWFSQSSLNLLCVWSTWKMFSLTLIL